MDMRSWPWKKKSSDKSATTPDATAALPDKGSTKGDQGKTKGVQVPADTYANLIEAEAQVKVLNDKLSSSQTEITAKDALVKQHARVAEEAIAGWEKAEAESLELKNQLESVTLLKLTAEDRASQLDEALKECMMELRMVKEDSEQQLHDTVFANTNQLEAMKSEFEAKVFDFEQELQRSSAENAALSRSLQERSSMLIRISGEKSQAEAEIEVLKSGIQSCEKEISSLKYEVHVVTKEIEIRNEEKNMSGRLAETANKQHLEDVKKITKLEAECQRLRGLVKKKLPGPAALAQMKLEVDNLGREYGETRLRRSPAKNSSSMFSLEDLHQCQKENEFLTARLLATEEETKMLKEALSKRNNELQATRTICAKTASKLRRMSNSNTENSFEGSPRRYHIPRASSMSEDGIDDEGSCSESCSIGPMSEFSLSKENNDKSKHIELMDDFLEMERLASTESNGTVNKAHEGNNGGVNDGNTVILSQLKSRITSLFENGTVETDVGKLSEDIRQILQDTQNDVSLHPSETHQEACSENGTSKHEQSTEDMGRAADKLCTNKHAIEEDLKNALSQIQHIMVPLCKEVVEIQGRSSDAVLLEEKVTEFSASINKVICGEVNLDKFIFALSHMLSEAKEVRLNMLDCKRSEEEGNSNDCIDKLTLLEKRISQHEPTKPNVSGECEIASPSSSHPANSHRVNTPGCELQVTSRTLNLKEHERMKIEKDRLEMDLVRCNETSERAKLQLVETEQQLVELKSQLVACQKSNSLSETQLKCMAESYKSLESRTQELETEINLHRAKAEALSNELQKERSSHQDALAKCKDLQEQIESLYRETRCSTCSLHADADEEKGKQDRDIAAAAEKLAECQETILLLGRQLQTLQPPTETSSSLADKLQMTEYLSQGQQNHTSTDNDNDDSGSVIMLTGDGADSPSDRYNSNLRASDLELIPSRTVSSSKSKKNRARSASSSSLSSMLNEKQSRGFSRFFSKGKGDH